MRIRQFVLLIQLLFGRITFFKKLLNDLKFFGQSDSFFIIVYPFFLGTDIFNNKFRFFGVIPKVRCKGFLFFVGNLYLFFIDVKDTSLTHQGAQ